MVSIRHGSEEAHFEGAFTAVAGSLPGLLTADGWGFRWSGTGEPFFWNATTAYLMAGLSEDRITQALSRLHAYGINRVRVSLCPSR